MVMVASVLGRGVVGGLTGGLAAHGAVRAEVLVPLGRVLGGPV